MARSRTGGGVELYMGGLLGVRCSRADHSPPHVLLHNPPGGLTLLKQLLQLHPLLKLKQLLKQHLTRAGGITVTPLSP